MIRRPETPQIEFLLAGSLDDPSLFNRTSEALRCRADLLINSIEGTGWFAEERPTELVRDVVAAHFARHY
jgi:hypothetical protein